MKTKLFLTLIFLFGISILNAFSQEDSMEQENALFNDYTFESNGKSFKIKDAVFTTEGLSNSQSTAFAVNINGNKCIMTNIRASGSDIVNGVRLGNGEFLKIPLHVFVSPESDILFFKNLNIIEAIDVNFKDDLSEILKEGDEVLVFGNHLGVGTLEARISCIDSIGVREINLKNFETLRLYYEERINKINRTLSDLSFREQELFSKNLDGISSEVEKIKADRLNLLKEKSSIRMTIRHNSNLQMKYRGMFSFSSIGSPVIHLKSGKCIGFLSLSCNYKWDNIETGRFFATSGLNALDNGFFNFSFTVLRFDSLKRFSNVTLSDIKDYSRSFSEAVAIYSYVSLFLKDQRKGSSDIKDLSFPNINYLEDFIVEKDFLKKLYEAQVKYSRRLGKGTDEAMRNSIKEYYSNLHSIVFGLRSRLKNSKAYIAFKKDVDPLIRRMESLEKDLDMVKRYN